MYLSMGIENESNNHKNFQFLKILNTKHYEQDYF